jgi:hypothetical protein
MKELFPLLARIFLSGIFLFSGFGKIAAHRKPENPTAT